MKVWIFSLLVGAAILEIPPAYEVYKDPGKYCKMLALPGFPLAWLTCNAMGKR